MTSTTGKRLFGCFVKLPLGCGAFAFGAALVAALLLPQACGRLAGEELEDGFAHTFQGRLEVGDARLLSVLEDQRVDDFRLLDPAGDPVLQGSWRAPSLREVFQGRERETLGLGRLTLFNVRLVEGDDGVTNLERALAFRDDGEERRFTVRMRDGVLEVGSPPDDVLTLERYREYALDLAIERLLWSTPATRARGSEVLLRNVRGRVSLSDATRGEGLRLSLDGRVEGQRDGRVQAILVQERPGGPRRSLEVEGEELPLAALGDLFGVDFVGPFGERAARFLFTSGAVGPHTEAIQIELTGDEGDLRLRGVLDDERQVLSGDKGISIELAPRPYWTDFLFGATGFLRALEVQPADDTGRWHAEIDSYALPLVPDPARLSARLSLELGPCSVRLAPELRTALALPDEPPLLLDGARFVLAIREGRVGYDQVTLPVGDELLAVRGWHDLSTDAVELEVDLPPAWRPAGAGAPAATKLRGTWQALSAEAR